MWSSTLIGRNPVVLLISTIGLLNSRIISGFLIEVHDANPQPPRKYPWQLCRGHGYKGKGIGDQVFAIDRQITTCERENADSEWFDRPIPENVNPTSFFAVYIGAPPPEEGSSTKTPVMYTEDPPGEAITMEVAAWENTPAQFHVQRANHFVNGMHFTELYVKPKDRLYFYWPPLSENLPHGGNPDFRMFLAYRKVGPTLRLGYTLTRFSIARITPEHPQVQFVASDGSVWDNVEPLPDEKRHEHIADVIAAHGGSQSISLDQSQVDQQRAPNPDELAAEQKKSGSFRRFFGKIGKGIFKKKGITSDTNQPGPEPQGVGAQEDNKEEEKIDVNESNQRNRGPQWYGDEEEIEDLVLEEDEVDSPRYSDFGMGGISLSEIEEVQRSNNARNQPSYIRSGRRAQGSQNANLHGRIGDLDNTQ
ncbi:hypothetical protein TWF718_010467 [Orbilia javanica]|uniref:Uncharacterized protein n=1 Tax=Orbilia javanica TaxID=47235 RepID=A0AAN8RL19_9PEZI